MICVQCHADDATTIRREGGSDDRLDLCDQCAQWFDNLEPRERGVDDYAGPEVRAHRERQGLAIKYDRTWEQR